MREVVAEEAVADLAAGDSAVGVVMVGGDMVDMVEGTAMPAVAFMETATTTTMGITVGIMVVVSASGRAGTGMMTGGRITTIIMTSMAIRARITATKPHTISGTPRRSIRNLTAATT